MKLIILIVGCLLFLGCDETVVDEYSDCSNGITGNWNLDYNEYTDNSSLDETSMRLEIGKPDSSCDKTNTESTPVGTFTWFKNNEEWKHGCFFDAEENDSSDGLSYQLLSASYGVRCNEDADPPYCGFETIIELKNYELSSCNSMSIELIQPEIISHFKKE